jgi:hypothetical protein
MRAIVEIYIYGMLPVLTQKILGVFEFTPHWLGVPANTALLKTYGQSVKMLHILRASGNDSRYLQLKTGTT